MYITIHVFMLHVAINQDLQTVEIKEDNTIIVKIFYIYLLPWC